MVIKKHSSNLLIIFFLVLFAILISSSVFAIGIAPAKTIVPAEIGTHTYSGLIINNEGLDTIAKIELVDSYGMLSLDLNEIQLSPTISEYPFTYQIEVTESNILYLGKLGYLSVYSIQEVGSQVSAQLTVKSSIYLGSESDASPNLYVETKNEEKSKINPLDYVSFDGTYTPPELVQKTKNAFSASTYYLKNNPRALFGILISVILIITATYVFLPLFKKDNF
ncbi:hypothetical protein HOC01_03325 [archaeon]|jgi:hypothetical protein|nr:hypothetical protein [archaeon]MBT6698079.1 hypothetical protein [archaeon]